MVMRTKTRLLIASRLARERSPTPLGAFFKGLLAGAAGAFIQNQFFKATEKLKLKPDGSHVPEEEGGKPEPESEETSLETVAHRWVEGLMRRGPLSQEGKEAGGAAVHYLFGAGWGGLYGLARESFPWMSPALFGAVVWLLSDNVILPAFRL